MRVSELNMSGLKNILRERRKKGCRVCYIQGIRAGYRYVSVVSYCRALNAKNDHVGNFDNAPENIHVPLLPLLV